MKVKNKKAIFICQVTDNACKVIKCLKDKFLNLELEKITPDIDDKKLAEKVTLIFNRLGYTRNPIIVSLPRNQAVCRYLKIPAQEAQEIEKIAALQAPKYLPYPATALITGYQVLFADKEGNAYINLIIAHKDAIARYFDIFKSFKPAKVNIVLSSYGLCNLYHYLRPHDLSPTLLIDMDAHQAEFAIISQKKLSFSRYFKLDTFKAGWESVFINEIRKTHEAYLKEVSSEVPGKIIMVSAAKLAAGFGENLKKQLTLPVEILSYLDELKIAKSLTDMVSNGEYSFSGLFGLGLAGTEESLNLFMPESKAKARQTAQQKERIKIVLFLAAAVFIFAVAVIKNLSDKAVYLKNLNRQLDKIKQEAEPLEKFERRLNLWVKRLQNKPSGLEILYALHKAMPQQVSLVNFSYEEDKQVVLRGQAPEINSVVAFNSALEKSAAFKNFNIGIRFTTTRRTQAAEFIDFEIVCNQK